MQLQAERDHFVHSGIGGGSSSSSPSCSPPKDSPLSVIKVHNLKKPKAKTKDNEKEKGKEIKHGEEKVQETKHKEMRQETQKAVEVIEVKDLNMSMDMDVDMDTAKDAADTDVDMKNNKRKELKAGKAIFTVATEAATPVLSRDTRVTLDASYLLKQQFATSTPPSFTPSLAPLSAAAFSQLPSELFFNVLCLLDALDLTRLAQVNKFCARMVSDNGVWRVKSKQHPLFLERHIQGRRGVVPWLEYYKFLHRNSNIVKQNWADARPQAVHVLEGHTGLVSSLETSMWTLVTASIDSTLRVWDLRTLQCVRVLHAQQPLTCVSQSEIAGAACARTSFGGLYVWDIRTGELIMQDDTAMPQTASFMYMDECYIGYGQSDGAVTVFDWSSRTTLKVVGSYQAHEGDVIHISIMNRKYVISASTNGETLVYCLKRSCVMERILLPHATQAIQFTPTIHGDKVMFSTRDAVYEYELMLDYLKSGSEQEFFSFAASSYPDSTEKISSEQRRGKENQVPLSSSHFAASNHLRMGCAVAEASTSNHTGPVSLRPVSASSSRTSTSGRVWKTSNSLLSQIRQRVGGTGKAFDQERLIIPTRFPRAASICCLPRTCRTLEHGTTSARDSYGIFMPLNCTRLNEMSVYTRATKQIKQIHGPAVDAVLTEAIRNRFYTTMECNQHCAVVSSGSKVYVISFLPPDI